MRKVLFSLTGQGRAAATASRRHRRDWLNGRLAERQVIPAKHCGQFVGDEISPALTWAALHAGTADLVLVLEDLDNPGAVPGIHTIAAFAPAEGGLPEGALTPGNPGVQFLPNRCGQAKYVGPRPVPGHGAHRYRFHLYALDTDTDFSKVAGVDHLPSALDGHVLASGTLTGTRTSSRLCNSSACRIGAHARAQSPR